MKRQGYNHTNCRLSGLAQVLLGISCVVFGIVDRLEMADYESGFPAKGVIGIWIGILIVITGIVGFTASLQVNVKLHYLVITYFISSIISTLLAFIVADCYIISLVFIKREGDCNINSMGRSPPVIRYYGTVSADWQCEVRRKLAIVMIVMSLCELVGAVLAIFTCIQIYRSQKQYDLAESPLQMEPVNDPEKLETVDEKTDRDAPQPVPVEI